MDQKDNRSPDLDLEDIMKEFGSHEPAPEEIPGGEPPVEESSEHLPEERPAEEEITGDTVRLDRIQKAVHANLAADDTAVFSPIEDRTAPYVPLADDDTAIFAPVSQEEAQRYSAVTLPEEWDEDLVDYTPPPIEFKPKSRLQQLRSKLVAGPEKRYYELSEQGFGKLQVGIFLSLLIFVIAAGATVLYALGLVSPERLRLLVYIQLLSMLLAALVGCYRLLDGLGDLLHLRFTLNTWLALTFMVCCADGVLCLDSKRICCSALFCLEMLLAQIGAYQQRSTEILQMDTLRKASELEALVRCEDHFAGKPGFATVSGEPEAFMDACDTPATPEKVLRWYSLASLLVSAGLGIYAGVKSGLATGVQVTAGAMLLAMPATVFISMTRPQQLLQKRLHKLGTVLCGWQGVRQIPKRAVYPLTSLDLFPAGMTKLNGIKFLGQFNPDTVVCYAASLAAADGGSLDPLLRQQLAGRNGQLLEVEDLHRYSGGISGVINGTPVILGTLEFMNRMGVELPQGTKLPQAVCLAVDGAPAGLFAVAYGRSKSSNAGLRTLCAYRWLQPLLATPDFMLTSDFLAKKFTANTKKVLLPEYEARLALLEKEPAEDAPVIALLTREGLAPKAFALTGARVLRTSLTMGVVIHMLGGILGMVAALLLSLAGAASLLTPVNLLVYCLIWMVPGFLVTQWTRVL